MKRLATLTLAIAGLVLGAGCDFTNVAQNVQDVTNDIAVSDPDNVGDPGQSCEISDNCPDGWAVAPLTAPCAAAGNECDNDTVEGCVPQDPGPLVCEGTSECPQGAGPVSVENRPADLVAEGAARDNG